MPDNDDLRPLIGLDRLIHEPARLVIVSILDAVESADFLYLLRETGLGKGNLSSHLARLEKAGYVEIEKTYRGKTPLTVCYLTRTGREAFQAYLAQIKPAVDRLHSRNPGRTAAGASPTEPAPAK